MAGGKCGADTVAPIGSARPRSPAPAEPPAAAARQSSRKCTGWASRGGRTGRKRARAPGLGPQVAQPSESEAHPPQRGCAPTGAAARRMRAPRRAPWAPRRPMQLAAGAKKPPPRGGKAAGPSPGPRPMTSRPRRGSGCARPSSTAVELYGRRSATRAIADVRLRSNNYRGPNPEIVAICLEWTFPNGFALVFPNGFRFRV